VRTRVLDWYDLANEKPLYGFQVFSGGRWCNAAEDDKPCIYATEAERDAKRAEFRRIKEPQSP